MDSNDLKYFDDKFKNLETKLDTKIDNLEKKIDNIKTNDIHNIEEKLNQLIGENKAYKYAIPIIVGLITFIICYYI